MARGPSFSDRADREPLVCAGRFALLQDVLPATA